MPRQPKPFFRKQTKSWYFSTGGRQHNLGKDRDAAFAMFHEMMLEPDAHASNAQTLYEISQSYLDWVETNRKPKTYDRCRYYLESFIGHVGRQMKVGTLKPHHLSKWVDKDSWNSTTRNDAIGVVQRMLNWAVEEGYLSRTPIPKLKKPIRKRREVVYTPDQWKQIKEHARGHLVPLLDFLWITGCRPKEARTLEARHVHEELIIFPPDESKGEADSRVIFLTPEAASIVHPLVQQYPTGPIFRNSQGNAWTKDSIKCRLTRITEKVGFRVIAYGARHSYATNALIQAVDTVSLSHLMGHKSTRMINNYAHLGHNLEFLMKQAISAAPKVPAS